MELQKLKDQLQKIVGTKEIDIYVWGNEQKFKIKGVVDQFDRVSIFIEPENVESNTFEALTNNHDYVK